MIRWTIQFPEGDLEKLRDLQRMARESTEASKVPLFSVRVHSDLKNQRLNQGSRLILPRTRYLPTALRHFRLTLRPCSPCVQ
jgi:hypothetical protein